MTPGARISAAIDLLDEILAGAPAEKALTGWARRSRFAGSKDRAAVRDHVFDALRNLRSYAVAGGSGGAWPPAGRAVMLGACRVTDAPLDGLFSGIGHAPAPVTEEELARCIDPGGKDLWNLPDWLIDRFSASLDERASAQARQLSGRAPVTLRVNTQRATRDEVMAVLTDEGFACRINSASDTAVTLTEKSRGLTGTKAFSDGLFELQDAASQAAIDGLDLAPGMRVLDFCAGGGGKALAIAARTGAEVWAHDAEPARMADIAPRAARAGARINCVSQAADLEVNSFDLIIVDAPCSGSGTWRRTPDAKWRLTPERLQDLEMLQRDILMQAVNFLTDDGQIAYFTCSVLNSENEDQAAWAAENLPLRLAGQTRWWISEETDGFYAAHLRRY